MVRFNSVWFDYDAINHKPGLGIILSRRGIHIDLKTKRLLQKLISEESRFRVVPKQRRFRGKSDLPIRKLRSGAEAERERERERSSMADSNAERPLRKISTAFKELAATVSSPSPEVSVAQFSHACSLVSPLFGCLGIAFKFAQMDYVAKVTLRKKT